MDDNVLHFLDKTIPHQRLLDLPNEVADFKTVVDNMVRPEAMDELQEVGAGQDSTGGGPMGDSDAVVEMSTIMEGFRYLKNDNQLYPVIKDGPVKTLVEDFPIIPIGMLKIWREQDEDGDLDAMLGM